MATRRSTGSSSGSTQHNPIEKLFGQFKYQIMMLLNDTADEFDKQLTTEEARKVYNDFTGSFGKKVLELRVHVDTDKQ